MALHPRFKMPKVVSNLSLDNTKLGEDSLLLRFVQVMPQSLAERLLPLAQRRAQSLELFDSEVVVERSP